MKSRFLHSTSILTDVTKYFREIILNTNVLQYADSGEFYSLKNYCIVSVDDSFTIFSLEYDSKFLYEAGHRAYLYPNLDKTEEPKFKLRIIKRFNLGFQDIDFSKEDIEIIINETTQTFTINLKINNEMIK
ncbi:hypothetical protein [Cetobacterium sp.]|uniref:hypothetical protein n=1 Tax=Cetobacterium sp. TaxID=2071632 RepID=UPI003F3F1408